MGDDEGQPVERAVPTVDVQDVLRRFAELTHRFLDQPSVAVGTGFGASRGLRVGGRIFAIFGESSLTVKLPKRRVDELIEAGIGTRFDPGRGRFMREWVTVSARDVADWESLGEEALAFVRTLV
jgi:hypothetical protein